MRSEKNLLTQKFIIGFLESPELQIKRKYKKIQQDWK
ncbi:unnamed protein product [Paramecium sonneborni]|uniref:Uncharacterized protein n=1 Tax=Paramecium sonneborni TaxID=65129 RepID=A0A8S1M3G7_9CILI|nr:unnamed protein product [Paramecium sonneborni]